MQVRQAFAAACALFVLGVAGLAGCSTDAVGIEACRRIQQARCEVAPACLGQEGFEIETEEQVENCTTYYVDGCLVGVENPNESVEGADTTGETCEAAVRALGKCAAAGAATMAGCEKAEVDNEALTPCEVLAAPHHLDECAWVEEPADEDE